MLKAEHQQEQRVRENAANCEQLKSELERIQRRQPKAKESSGEREPGPRSERPPVQDQSPVWRWMRLPDRRDGLTLTARLRNT